MTTKPSSREKRKLTEKQKIWLVRREVRAYMKWALEPGNACEFVQLAIKRHLRDLETGEERGLYFDEAAAAKPILFAERYCRLSKGKYIGQRIKLLPWQKFIYWVVFGWKVRETGARRFTKAYIEVAKKNGKSSGLGSPLGLYGLCGDGEGGAEVYSGGTKKEQAQIVHGEALRMVRQSPELKKRLTINKYLISYEKNFSTYSPLSADVMGADGINPHFAIMDEVHQYKTRDLFDIVEQSMATRDQPLFIMITTAGTDTHGICYQQRTLVVNTLREHMEQDSLFGIIFTLDEGDDPFDESVWIKANPSLGKHLKLETLREKVNEAKLGAGLNTVLRFRFNIWTKQEKRWLPMDEWRKCKPGLSLEELKGRPCFLGVDISSTRDLTALAFVFQVEGGYQARCRFFCPEENVYQRIDQNRELYETFVQTGHLIPTPGNVVDQDFVKQEILLGAEQFQVQEVVFDRANSSKIMTELISEGLTVVPYGQGYLSMSPPAKFFETLVCKQHFFHMDDRVLNWMAENVAIEEDPAGNIKPSKRKSGDKIDGIVAICMALGRMISTEAPGENIYLNHGIRYI